jgi:hypothetical protein
LPALFCFSVTRRAGSEIELVRAQFAKGVGIFGCNYWAVYTSGGTTWLSPGRVQTRILPDYPVIARRPQAFIEAWMAVVRDGRFRNARWTVKVEPLAVFLPGRLRNTLLKYHNMADGRVALRTCSQKAVSTGEAGKQSVQDEGEAVSTGEAGKQSVEDEGTGGPLQVLSRAATEAFVEAIGGCEGNLSNTDFSENTFIERCLSSTGVRPIDATKMNGGSSLVADPACVKHSDVSHCRDNNVVLFHPFKIPLDYFLCLRDTQGIPGTGYKGTVRRSFW